MDISGTPWFVAPDVCRVFGLSNVTKALLPLSEDEKGLTPIQTLGGVQRLNTISESGLYKLVMRSEKPEAKAFQEWVTREVLPAIRKDGMYVAGEHGRAGDLRNLDELRGLRIIASTAINANELRELGPLSTTNGQSRGQDFTAYYLTEEQALLIVSISRTEAGKKLRAELIRVFTAWRRGNLAPATPNFGNPAEAARAWALGWAEADQPQRRP